MMSSQCSWISIIVAMIFLQIFSISSTPILSESNHQQHHHLTDEHASDNQHSQRAFLSFIKGLLDETNPHEQVKLLNQLREYLNEICLMGYLGPTHGQACQHVLEILRQNSLVNHHSNEETSDTSSETHGIQKRFFCNGFIGCKSSSG